jgi:2-keto-4-pentenoate hydratase
METVAEILWAARRDGTVVPATSVPEPQDNNEAYAIQHEIARLSGYETRGFKVGSTSQAAQQILGSTGPGSGVLLAPYMFDSPATIAIVPEQSPLVEGELAFRMGRDLPSRRDQYERAEVVDAIEAVAGAVEIVGTRIDSGVASKGQLLVTADGGANIALVTGSWYASWRDLDLKSHRISVTINGKPGGSGEGANALGDPVNVMIWLANQQSKSGRGLKAGDIVSTGNCTGVDPVKPGDSVVVDYANLGTVEITFE